MNTIDPIPPTELQKFCLALALDCVLWALIAMTTGVGLSAVGL